MHPNFIQICEEIRKVFPNIILSAYTNGLLLNKFTDNDLIYLVKNLNVNISSSLYPSNANLIEYKKQNLRFKKLNLNLSYQSSHFYFNKIIYKDLDINITKDMIKDRFNNCRTLTKYNNLITIYKNKILVCCGEVGYFNNNKKVDISDLLDLNTLKNEEEIFKFCEQPHNICKNCYIDNANNDIILWQKKNDISKKHEKNSLDIIFSEYYDDYKKLYLDDKEHINCLKDEFFYSKFLPDATLPGEITSINTKYLTGIADIYIPYQESFNIQKCEQLIHKLKSIINIEKYNLYFIGINNTKEHNKLIFQTLNRSLSDPLNLTFLQSNSIFNGYKEFIKYSYLNKKILLDIDDFLKINKNILED